MGDATTLDGKVVSAAILSALQARIQKEALRPHLHVITVGDDPASQVYVKQKRQAAEKAGIFFSQTLLPSTIAPWELRQAIMDRNLDRNVHGIIIQLPLPASLQSYEREVLDLVDSSKDVDCFHPTNIGLLALGRPAFLPATPAGILRFLDHYGIETRGKLCVVLGKSNIVGKPLSLLLSNEDGPAATVVMCDQHTRGVWDITRQADILVVATGKHHLVRDPAVLRPDGTAVVVDVGIHRVQAADGKMKMQGDCDTAALRPACRYITPVPGGVGPMTVAMLLEQVVEACAKLTPPHMGARFNIVGQSWEVDLTYVEDLLARD